jgi:hypothetical protein
MHCIKSIILLLTCVSALPCSAVTIWSGPSVSFSKDSFADPSLATNQDRLTDSVWLTRGNLEGIYNARSEMSFDYPEPPLTVLDSPSPLGTMWAFGTTDDIGSLTFDTWLKTIEQNPPNSVNQPMVVHLTDDDIYLDLMFTAWGVGNGAGGSFAYTRSTPDPIPEPGAAVLALGLAGGVYGLVGRRRIVRSAE